MTKHRVRAKNTKQAMMRARRKWPGMVVSKVNWLQDSPKLKDQKLYQAVVHKRTRRK